MIQCPRCGATSGDTAQFCSGCGIQFAVQQIQLKRKNSIGTTALIFYDCLRTMRGNLTIQWT